jgi:hypothetical protein
VAFVPVFAYLGPNRFEGATEIERQLEVGSLANVEAYRSAGKKNVADHIVVTPTAGRTGH